ncbi:hypothetical protein FM106_31895 [Brachybacterium faecium]|nr:hypothetical protein FM106_31895 [Brachybacterium faecium]
MLTIYLILLLFFHQGLYPRKKRQDINRFYIGDTLIIILANILHFF